MKKLSVLTDEDGCVDTDAIYELLSEIKKLGKVRSEFIVQYVTSSIGTNNNVFIVMELLVSYVLIARLHKIITYP